MDKSDAIEISFSENKKDKVACVIFIDEFNLAVGGTGKCFIANLKTQERSTLGFKEQNRCVMSFCVNKNKTLVGYNTYEKAYLYNIQEKVTHSFPFWRGYNNGGLLTLGFNSQDELTAYGQGYFARFNEKLEANRDYFHSLLGAGVYHFRENIFLCTFKNHLIEYTDCNGVVHKKIKMPLCFYQIFCSPEHTFIALRTMKNRMFIVDTQKAPSKNDYAVPIIIKSEKSHYLAAAFYPKNTFIALLKTNGLLEYRDYIEPEKVITTQKVINEELIGLNFNSIHFSPEGTKVAVVINGKYMLLNIPLDIQYPNRRRLIYFCFNKQNMPKEIFFIIMDLIDSLGKK